MSDWNFAAVVGRHRARSSRTATRSSAATAGSRSASFDDRATPAGLAPAAAGRRCEPGDKVAIDLTNRPEYLETFFAALKLGCVPVNVNYRYVADEIHYLLDELRRQGRRARPRRSRRRSRRRSSGSQTPCAAARSSRPASPTSAALAAARAGRRVGARARPTGDDLIFLYTGGTTGMPKGVMWRNDDLYVGAVGRSARPGPEPPDPIAAARARASAPRRCLPACPLMHGTGLFTTLADASRAAAPSCSSTAPGSTPSSSGTGRAQRRGRCSRSSATCSPGRCSTRSTPNPTAGTSPSLRAITSSGVLFSPEVKRGPARRTSRRVTIIDSLGASEGLAPRADGRAPATPTSSRPLRRVNDRVKVVDEEHGPRGHARAATRSGLVAMGGRIPLGYFKDPEKTAATFRVFDGTRYSIPGDYATVDADGTIQLLGRGSACINTGGEKVYPEEVELELRKHPACSTASWWASPTRASARRSSRSCRSTDGHYLDEAELAGVVPRQAGGLQDAAPVPARRLVCSARRRARPTTGSSAPSRSTCWPPTPR